MLEPGDVKVKVARLAQPVVEAHVRRVPLEHARKVFGRRAIVVVVALGRVLAEGTKVRSLARGVFEVLEFPTRRFRFILN